MTNHTLPLQAHQVLESIINSLNVGLLTYNHAQEIAEALDLCPEQGYWVWQEEYFEEDGLTEIICATCTLQSNSGNLHVRCDMTQNSEILRWQVELIP